MKTIFSLQTGIATLLCTAALAGLMAYDADTVEQQGGKLPDKEPLENIYGRLRSSSMSDDKVRIRMTEGSGFVTSKFVARWVERGERRAANVAARRQL